MPRSFGIGFVHVEGLQASFRGSKRAGKTADWCLDGTNHFGTFRGPLSIDHLGFGGKGPVSEAVAIGPAFADVGGLRGKCGRELSSAVRLSCKSRRSLPEFLDFKLFREDRIGGKQHFPGLVWLIHWFGEVRPRTKQSKEIKGEMPVLWARGARDQARIKKILSQA